GPALRLGGRGRVAARPTTGPGRRQRFGRQRFGGEAGTAAVLGGGVGGLVHSEVSTPSRRLVAGQRAMPRCGRGDRGPGTARPRGVRTSHGDEDLWLQRTVSSPGSAVRRHTAPRKRPVTSGLG